MMWKITFIPGRAESSVQSTVEVLVADVEPCSANTLIRKLNQVAPLESFRHVKRVRKKMLEGKAQLSVILCLSTEKDEGVIILKDLIDLIKAYDLHPYSQTIPQYAARSKEEWEEQCKLWPTSFHPPTYNINGVSGFSNEDSDMVCQFMKNAIELAKNNGSQVRNTAIIVDPLNRKVICTAHDETFVRCDTEKISVFANFFDTSECTSSNHDDQSKLCSSASCMYPWKWATHNLSRINTLQKDGVKYKWHPLRHAALVAIESASDRDRQLFPVSSPPVDCQTPILGLSSKRRKTDTVECKDTDITEPILNGCTAGLTRPYLCTGFDIYLLWEPCIMCAMALVHQRIRRIFYALPNPHAGALGSVHRLQGEKSLNHHYAVFKVEVPDEVIFDFPAKSTT